MRLLSYNNDGEIILSEFFGDKIPTRYAILSHTWEDDEVSFRDLLEGSGKMKAGYRKISLCGEQARRDGLDYFWVDTCCIDKSSSAELSEAINSMFKWYKKAMICYAYLSDVLAVEPTAAEFGQSRWFERGWTLQELLAPREIRFYTNQWNQIVFENDPTLRRTISWITKIDIEYLNGKSLSHASIAEKMSWASSRKTTREEDVAYSLLGIFSVQLSLLYGEGGVHAFFRLQEELLRTSNDHSIFLWDFIQDHPKWSIYHHALALSPVYFGNGGDIVCCDFGHSVSHSSVTNAGIHIKLPISHSLFSYSEHYVKAVFQCRRKDDFSNAIALPLFRTVGGAYARVYHPHMSVQQDTVHWIRARVKEIYLETRPGIKNMEDMILEVDGSLRYSWCIEHLPEGYSVRAIYPGDRQIERNLRLIWPPSQMDILRKPLEKDVILALIASDFENEHSPPFIIVMTMLNNYVSISELQVSMMKCGLEDWSRFSNSEHIRDLDYAGLQGSILVNGKLRSISVQPQTRFRGRLLIVRVEAAIGRMRKLAVAYKYVRWYVLFFATNPRLFCISVLVVYQFGPFNNDGPWFTPLMALAALLQSLIPPRYVF